VRRREFILFLGGAPAAWPLAVRAQQRAHVVGILAPQPLPPIERFVRKLSEYGYVEGQNLHLVRRFSEGHDDRFSAMAVELTALPVDLIVTQGTPAAIAAKQATRSIPVVMGTIGDPLSLGIVSNLARPGGNITGFTAQNADLEGKRLELLRDLLPQVSRAAMLANVANPLADASIQNLRTTAEQLHIAFDIFGVRSTGEIEAALQQLNNVRPDGVVIASDLMLLTRRSEIADFLAKNRLPAVYPFREYVGAGGLMILGANLGRLFERAAGYVDRIMSASGTSRTSPHVRCPVAIGAKRTLRRQCPRDGVIDCDRAGQWSGRSLAKSGDLAHHSLQIGFEEWLADERQPVCGTFAPG